MKLKKKKINVTKRYKEKTMFNNCGSSAESARANICNFVVMQFTMM